MDDYDYIDNRPIHERVNMTKFEYDKLMNSIPLIELLPECGSKGTVVVNIHINQNYKL